MRYCALACLILSSAVVSVRGEDHWSRFRGPNGSGVLESASPPRDVAGDDVVRWKIPVPSGASSPCLWGNHLFLTAFEEGRLWTLAYDRQKGTELWRVEAPAENIERFHFSEGSPAASTCATDGKRVVSYFGSCGLFCYDFKGKLLWKYELPTAETHNDFGTGTSPILVDGLVLLARDLKNGSLILALDAATGAERWKADRTGSPTAYSTPIVFGTKAPKQVIVAGAYRMKGYDLQSGDENWTLRGLPAANCTFPVVGDEALYFAGWSLGGEDAPMPAFDDLLKQFDQNRNEELEKPEMEQSFFRDFFDSNDPDHDGHITRDEWDEILRFLKKGSNSLFAFSPVGEGDITESAILWKHTKGLPYVPTPLYYQGRVFLIRDGGLISCFDAKSGKAVYESQRIAGGTDAYYASPVAARGCVYIVSLKEGVLSVIDSTARKPVVISQRKLDERVAATPALADDSLYLRSATQLYRLSAR